jgi:hypothetical protein
MLAALVKAQSSCSPAQSRHNRCGDVTIRTLRLPFNLPLGARHNAFLETFELNRPPHPIPAFITSQNWQQAYDEAWVAAQQAQSSFAGTSHARALAPGPARGPRAHPSDEGSCNARYSPGIVTWFTLDLE